MSPYSPVEVTEVKVPLYGVEGKQVVLRCVYNSPQPVYSVKWYVQVKLVVAGCVENLEIVTKEGQIWKFFLKKGHQHLG